MHSPFVFDFILNVLNNKTGYLPPRQLAQLRAQLLNENKLLNIEDMGAGSRLARSKKRTVAQLARTAVKPPKYGEMLYRLARHYQPSTIVELGTSLGLTSAYLAMAAPKATVFTIEGSQEIAAVAARNFSKLGLTNVIQLTGNFDQQLPQALDQLEIVDLCYIDGNHRYEPTVRYFERLLKKSNNNTILIFDDIHWSPEMEQAWAQIRQHPAVRCTVDIFQLGLVFFRQEFKVKQDHRIRF